MTGYRPWVRSARSEDKAVSERLLRLGADRLTLQVPTVHILSASDALIIIHQFVRDLGLAKPKLYRSSRVQYPYPVFRQVLVEEGEINFPARGTLETALFHRPWGSCDSHRHHFLFLDLPTLVLLEAPGVSGMILVIWAIFAPDFALRFNLNVLRPQADVHCGVSPVFSLYRVARLFIENRPPKSCSLTISANIHGLRMISNYPCNMCISKHLKFEPIGTLSLSLRLINFVKPSTYCIRRRKSFWDY